MALIVCQAGHYPRKSGATGTGGLDADPTEQEFTIAAATACARHLRAAGHECRVIWADVAESQYRGDAFVAIHCDGSTSRSARGASVGYRTSEGADLAARFKRRYQAEGWSGGWRPDNYTSALAGYYGTRHAVAQGTRRAFIAEAGFLTNPGDEALLSLPHGPERFARALTATVVEVFGGQEEDPMSALSDDEQRELLRLLRTVEDRTQRHLILDRDQFLDPTEHKQGRANGKTLVIGAIGTGLHKPGDDPQPGEGDLRGVFKELLHEVLDERESTDPSVPAG